MKKAVRRQRLDARVKSSLDGLIPDGIRNAGEILLCLDTRKAVHEGADDRNPYEGAEQMGPFQRNKRRARVGRYAPHAVTNGIVEGRVVELSVEDVPAGGLALPMCAITEIPEPRD